MVPYCGASWWLRLPWCAPSAPYYPSYQMIYSTNTLKKSHFPLILITIISPCLVWAGGVWWPGSDHTYLWSHGPQFVILWPLPQKIINAPISSCHHKTDFLRFIEEEYVERTEEELDRLGPGRSAVRFYSFFFQNSHKNQFFVWRRLLFNQFLPIQCAIRRKERTLVLKIIWHVWQFHMSKYW